MIIEGQYNDYSHSSLKKKFCQCQQQLVDEYVVGSNHVSHLSIQEKAEIYDLVNFKTWYFYFFLYGEISSSKSAPCLVLSDELEHHLKEKENRLENMSQSTRMDRRSERQSVIINQNHYHIEQMNVNN